MPSISTGATREAARFGKVDSDRASWSPLRKLAPSLLRSIRESTSAGYPLASASFKALIAGANRKIGPGRSGRPPKQANGPKDEARPDLLTETGL